MSLSSTGKRIPLRQRGERAVRKYTVPALSLVHLLFLPAGRHGDAWARWSSYWAASAFAAVVILLLRDLISSRSENRLPDVPSVLAWAAAGLLEFHALIPAVADSRLVPAVLFPSVAFLLPGLPAAIYSAAASAWLLWSPGSAWPMSAWMPSIAGMAVLGTCAGWAARRRIGRPGAGREMMQEAIKESRSLVLPWEDPFAGRERKLPADIEHLGLLRVREEHMDAVRRTLEGLLPVTGAERIYYVHPSPGPGRPFRVGAAAHRGGEGGDGDLAIPDHFVPLREAMLFRRTFVSEAKDAGSWTVGEAKREERAKGIATAPVVVEGNVEGAILATRFAEGRWTEPVGQMLEMGAYFIAKELEGARQRYQEALHLAKQEGFHRLVRRIAEISEKADGGRQESVSPRGEVYRVAAEQVRRHLDVDRVLLVETAEDGKRGRIAWEAGGTTSRDGEEWVPVEGTYLEWVTRHGVHRIFSDAGTGRGKFPVLPPAWSDDSGEAHLLVPVPGTGGFRGVLACASRRDRNFDGRDAEAVAEILAIMRMGISHALRLETLEKQAECDGLTGLLNRKTFQERLNNVLSRLDGRYACAVIMIDIDHFKKINDTYGHPAGDEVLRKVSSVIRKTVRKVDMAARYGGEEFVLYLHMTDRQHAVQVAERLRLMIRQTRFVFGGKELGVTASLGVACHPAHGRTGEELLGHADISLYRSKESGRDRTSVYLEQ
ncbi:MAG: GGDEF domain-containing protein [Deltaproteobacteria bacterium]|nr:GGDEF domain-containing protein [Deltaproteobacteria bacterium]